MKIAQFPLARIFLPILFSTFLLSFLYTAVFPDTLSSTTQSNLQLLGADTFTVTGTVTAQATQMPVANVQVFAFSGEVQTETVTNAQGSYTLTLASNNAYDIVFNPSIGSQLASQGVRGIGISQTIDVVLPSGFSISGTVFSDDSKTVGVANTAVFAFNTDTFSGFGLPPSGLNGNYQIALEPGKWNLTFTPPHFSGLGPTQTMVMLTADTTVDVILQPGFTIFGTIRDLAADPVSNVEIFAQDFSQSNGYGFTPNDGNGMYTGTLPSGTYDILLIPPPFQNLGAAVITDVVGPPDKARDITLPVGHTVSGTVFANGCATPLPNTFVSATPHTPGIAGEFGNWGKFAGEDGRYALPLPPGSYTITVDAPPSAQLPSFTITATLTNDLTLDLYFPPCTIYLPIILK